MLGASVPPPGDGEDRGDAARGATRVYPETQEDLDAEPAPLPAAGSFADGVLQRRRWKQDGLAFEDRLMARMDQDADPRCAKPLSP